ncbi:MAG TPA: dUTP diphosphatase [Dehalococcoidia bacterium]|nr:dUTP diphosphatase [Dehalococcoidia bacterium]
MTERIAIRFVLLRESAQAPRRMTEAATGYDLHACLPGGGFLDVGPDPVRVPTGIAIEAPAGWDVQCRPRSGLSAQGVIAVLGTGDPDYRGEIFVTMYTVGRRPPYRIQHGDRIAQLVVTRAADVEWHLVERLSETERGSGGYGSTGR